MPVPPFYTRHKGPFQLIVVREHADRKVKISSEMLSGRLDGEDCLPEARALLTDSRDTITSVSVWDVREHQHVMSWTKGDLDAGRMDLPLQQPEGALLPEREEPVQEMDAPLDQGLSANADAENGRPRVRSMPARSGKASPTVYRWINDDPSLARLRDNAAKVVEAFRARGSATLAEIGQDLVGQLTVDHPDHFIGAYASRLKKMGCLTVESAPVKEAA
jgi:hypothetical protein